ncbi:hypothetical protein V5O48_004509 [Marasmius crinis-equi]|uniref:Uncharacterized protein n=1 Tax=Marasmius crinis-equi TaxID=585013 RepID=A0ABR3FQ87_9AGAR
MTLIPQLKDGSPDDYYTDSPVNGGTFDTDDTTDLNIPEVISKLSAHRPTPGTRLANARTANPTAAGDYFGLSKAAPPPQLKPIVEDLKDQANVTALLLPTGEMTNQRSSRPTTRISQTDLHHGTPLELGTSPVELHDTSPPLVSSLLYDSQRVHTTSFFADVVNAYLYPAPPPPPPPLHTRRSSHSSLPPPSPPYSDTDYPNDWSNAPGTSPDTDGDEEDSSEETLTWRFGYSGPETTHRECATFARKTSPTFSTATTLPVPAFSSLAFALVVVPFHHPCIIPKRRQRMVRPRNHHHLLNLSLSPISQTRRPDAGDQTTWKRVKKRKKRTRGHLIHSDDELDGMVASEYELDEEEVALADEGYDSTLDKEVDWSGSKSRKSSPPLPRLSTTPAQPNFPTSLDTVYDALNEIAARMIFSCYLTSQIRIREGKGSDFDASSEEEEASRPRSQPDKDERPSLKDVMPVLFNVSDTEEEGTDITVTEELLDVYAPSPQGPPVIPPPQKRHDGMLAPEGYPNGENNEKRSGPLTFNTNITQPWWLACHDSPGLAKACRHKFAGLARSHLMVQRLACPAKILRTSLV